MITYHCFSKVSQKSFFVTAGRKNRAIDSREVTAFFGELYVPIQPVA